MVEWKGLRFFNTVLWGTFYVVLLLALGSLENFSTE